MEAHQDSTQIPPVRLNLHGKEARRMRYARLFLIGALVIIVSCADDTTTTEPTAEPTPLKLR